MHKLQIEVMARNLIWKIPSLIFRLRVYHDWSGQFTKKHQFKKCCDRWNIFCILKLILNNLALYGNSHSSRQRNHRKGNSMEYSSFWYDTVFAQLSNYFVFLRCECSFRLSRIRRICFCRRVLFCESVGSALYPVFISRQRVLSNEKSYDFAARDFIYSWLTSLSPICMVQQQSLVRW